MRSITAHEIDAAADLESLHAPLGGSHRAYSSSACLARRVRRTAVALVILAVGAGCADSSRSFPDLWDPWAVPAGARLVRTSPLGEVTGSPLAFYSGIENAEQGVVRDSAAWSTLWGRIVAPNGAPAPLPAVNFSRDMVVYAAIGTRSTGSHWVTIEPVYEAGGAYYAVVVEIRGGPGCVTSQALSTPVALVRAPRWAGDVRFVKRPGVVTLRCE